MSLLDQHIDPSICFHDPEKIKEILLSSGFIRIRGYGYRYYLNPPQKKYITIYVVIKDNGHFMVWHKNKKTKNRSRYVYFSNFLKIIEFYKQILSVDILGM